MILNRWFQLVASLIALLAEQSGSWTLGFYGSTVMALVAAVMAIKLRASSAALKAELRAAVPAG